MPSVELTLQARKPESARSTGSHVDVKLTRERAAVVAGRDTLPRCPRVVSGTGKDIQIDVQLRVHDRLVLFRGKVVLPLGVDAGVAPGRRDGPFPSHDAARFSPRATCQSERGGRERVLI